MEMPNRQLARGDRYNGGIRPASTLFQKTDATAQDRRLAPSVCAARTALKYLHALMAKEAALETACLTPQTPPSVLLQRRKNYSLATRPRTAKRV
jgi:hypothetical protein